MPSAFIPPHFSTIIAAVIGAKMFMTPQVTLDRLMTLALISGVVAEMKMMSVRGMIRTSLLPITNAGINIHQWPAMAKRVEARAAHTKPSSMTLFTEYLSAAHPSGIEARELIAAVKLLRKPSSSASAPRSMAYS